MKKSKIIAIRLVLTVCFFTLYLSFAQAEVTLTIGDGSGQPGSAGNPVKVSLANPDDKVKGIQLDICEDEDDYLSCTACETTERTSGFACTTEDNGIGCCSVILFDFGGGNINEGEGPILTLTYDVSGDAPSGECRNLNLEEVKVSDIDTELMNVTSESGEFCFPASSTTTTTLTTTTTTTITNTPSIGVSPDPMWKSRWVSLPYLLVIEGTGTHFEYFNTKLSFEPPGVVFPFFPIIWGELYIWDIVWVMPGWLAGLEDQTVTVTVITDDEEVSDDCMIKLLPFILDQ